MNKLLYDIQCLFNANIYEIFNYFEKFYRQGVKFRNVIIFKKSNYHVDPYPLSLDKDYPPYCPFRNSHISANSLLETELSSLSPADRAVYRAQRRWHRCLGRFFTVCQDEILSLVDAERQHAIYLRKKRIEDFNDFHAFLEAKE